MELLWLRYFQTAAQLESMTRAAEVHMVPQSAMSQTIARLEHELGVKLFTREKRRIFLNENGKAFLEKVQTALSAIDEGVHALRQTEQRDAIMVLALQDRGFVNDCVCRFSAVHPSVSFDLHYDAERIGGADLCIGDKNMAERYDHSAFLFEEQILLAVPADSPLAKKKNVFLRDIAAYPLITIGKGFPLTDMIDKLLAGSDARPASTIRCQDPHMVRNCVAAGLGVSFMPMAQWQGAQSDGICQIPIADLSLFRSSYLCWNDDISPIAAAFRDLVLEVAAAT